MEIIWVRPNRGRHKMETNCISKLGNNVYTALQISLELNDNFNKFLPIIHRLTFFNY